MGIHVANTHNDKLGSEGNVSGTGVYVIHGKVQI